MSLINNIHKSTPKATLRYSGDMFSKLPPIHNNELNNKRAAQTVNIIKCAY